MTHNIIVDGGTSVRLPTSGKYCDRDIVITAKGAANPTLQEKIATENGEVLPDEGYDGLSKVIVNIPIEELPSIEGVKF